MGEPERLEWWAMGKPATREQVEISVAAGLPRLEEMCVGQPGAREELERRKIEFEACYPPAEVA